MRAEKLRSQAALGEICASGAPLITSTKLLRPCVERKTLGRDTSDDASSAASDLRCRTQGVHSRENCDSLVVAICLRVGRAVFLGIEVLKWVNDGDSAYLGARVCGLHGLAGPFHTLAHSALERYLKGVLQGETPTVSADALRSQFGHDLMKLLDEAVKATSRLDLKRLRDQCKILDDEFREGRYLVGARIDVLTASDHVKGLVELGDAGAVDSLICAVRNETVLYLTSEEKQQSLLAGVAQARWQHWRELFLKENPAAHSFEGLDLKERQ